MEIPLCFLSELTEGKPLVVENAGQEIALILVNGEVYAYRNQCAHSGGPIGLGDVFGRTMVLLDENRAVIKEYVADEQLCLVCPWHGYEYDVKTGICIAEPKFRLEKLTVFERNEQVYLQSTGI